MKMPTFSAAASLYGTSRRYRSRHTGGASNNVVPAFPWDPPEISVTWQQPPYPFGRGFAGTLTITGQNFTPDADIHGRIHGCGAFDYALSAHTSPSFDFCPHPWDCRHYFGGSFTTAVSCVCGGTASAPLSASVEASDPAGNTAVGAADIPCRG
jgi:hypothetical protein